MWDPEYFGGGRGVDVYPVLEGVDKVLVTAEMSHYPELNLGIIGRHDKSSRETWHKGFADLPPSVCTDRDVLEIRVGGTEPSGGGESLVESRVDLPVRGVYEGRERLYVGGKELFDSPEFQDLIHDRVLVRYVQKRCLISGVGAVLVLLRLG